MRIVIFAGGTGSESLQSALVEQFGKELDYTVIVNGYDNGKSTGLCRVVMDGDILGPSDIRKNQLFRHKLIHGQTQLLAFLDLRVSSSRNEIESLILSKMDGILLSLSQKAVLITGITNFFAEPKSHEIEYVDFAISNIIYAGLARENFNSMVIASKIMAEVLDIPLDSVVISDDESLYLTASTESGHVILDEGDIVEWSNPNDKIVNIDLRNKHGHLELAVLSPECKELIKEADMIIYSAGTQWSSLIPTYVHHGFQESVDKAKAKQYLVFNVKQDKDILGVSGIELLQTIGQYLPLEKITVLTSIFAQEELNIREDDEDYDKDWNILNCNLSEPDGFKHCGSKLVKAIFDLHFCDAVNSEVICFDFDDTLVARDDKFKKISEDNIQRFTQLFKKNPKFCICTGNSSKAILSKVFQFKDCAIYSERGANVTIDGQVEISALKYIFTEDEIREIIYALGNVGIPLSKIQNRFNIIIAIKPINDDYKEVVINLLRLLFPELMIITAGKTTVEISKQGLNKGIITSCWFNNKRIAYVGDEYETGNDVELFRNKKVNFVKIDSVFDTNIFLRVLGWATWL